MRTDIKSQRAAVPHQFVSERSICVGYRDLDKLVWDRGRAFSLVELMLATIILGFGLLMIGAVLPIAWQSSVDLSAQTKADGAADAAKYYVQAKCRVDGTRDLFDNTTPGSFHNPLLPGGDGPDSVIPPPPLFRDSVSYSFLGDFDTPDFIDTNVDGIPDTGANGNPIVIPRVHALHVENWAVYNGSNFIPSLPPPSPSDKSVPEAPILIDYYPPSLNMPFLDQRSVGIPAMIFLTDPAITPVGVPAIKLRDRVFPPIQESLTPEDYQWLDVLSNRKFAWGVLHRLLTVPKSANESRQFMMYYVTLRRGSSGNRYARQDHNSLPLGLSGVGRPPQALKSYQDVMFPIAWRVPLLIIESIGSVPAIAIAGAPDLSSLNNLLPTLSPPLDAPFEVDNSSVRVADMFPRGAFLVDEVNGNVYRVTQREFVDEAVARLTLDKEVRIIDLEPPDITPSVLEIANYRNRVVWVYPPAVAKVERLRAGDPVSFTGPSPVVDIRMEPLTLMP